MATLDATELAHAVADHPDDLDRALTTYEPHSIIALFAPSPHDAVSAGA